MSPETRAAAATVHVFSVGSDDRKASRQVCPDCGEESIFAGVHYPYYGWDVTCLLCGRNWKDGEWMPLPFCRGSRAKSIRQARDAFFKAAARG